MECCQSLIHSVFLVKKQNKTDFPISVGTRLTLSDTSKRLNDMSGRALCGVLHRWEQFSSATHSFVVRSHWLWSNWIRELGITQIMAHGWKTHSLESVLHQKTCEFSLNTDKPLDLMRFLSSSSALPGAVEPRTVMHHFALLLKGQEVHVS